jgi:hypothetical protein
MNKLSRTTSFLSFPEFEKKTTIDGGTDPLAYSEDNPYENQTERHLAKICWFARTLFQLNLKINNEENDWALCFSAKKLQHKSPQFASYVSSAFQLKIGKLKQLSQLILHDVAVFLPKGYQKNHAFQVVEVANNKYLIDLTIRQYLEVKLQLSEKPSKIIHSLLQNGFIKLTKDNFETYLNFFYNRCLYEKSVSFSKNEGWSIEKEGKFSDNFDNLSQSTYILPK